MADEANFQLPGITYWALPTGYGGLLPEYPPDLIVVHKTDNARSTARGEAQYAHTRPSLGATSSHFYVDATEVIGSVPLNYKAWAAHSFGNAHGWHVESCGMTGTFMTAADQRAVGLVRQLCARGNIPVRHLSTAEIQAGARGIVGHHDLVVATGQGDHTDPGWTAAQWAEFIAAIGGQGEATLRRPDMLMFKDANHPEVYLPGSDGVRVHVDPDLFGRLKAAGVPLVEVADEAQLTKVVGPAVKPAVPIDVDPAVLTDAVRAVVRAELDATGFARKA